jgi:hypothetical protein
MFSVDNALVTPFRRMRMLGLIAAVAFLFCPKLLAEDYFTYLKEIHHQAEKLEIYRNTTWLYLLHYYPVNVDSQSDITDARFFLAEDGHENSRAELYETLEAIFDPVFEKGNRHGQCLFRSRFFWLDSQLKFDRRYLPQVNCKNYTAWRELTGAQSISLVFASSFMDNPGSVYGHTFLKINHEKGGKRLNLLDHVIQYQALPEDSIGILYAFKGIFGGYKGLYPLDPYYIPIQNNIEFEDRSIWEYELNLTDFQMELLLTHSWELAHFYTDYYFFKQNCAYRILELIEIANPDYHFKDKFTFWAIPSESVVYVLQQEGLVRGFNYFPSRTRQLMQKFDFLSKTEQELLLDLVHDPGILKSARFKDLPKDRQIIILDTILDYLRSRVNQDRDEKQTRLNRNKILLARSKLGISQGYDLPAHDEQSIHTGHAPARFQTAIGSQGDKPFLQVAIRPSYHDLLADDTGHLRNSHFTTFDVYLRANEEEWTLYQMDLVYLFDLAPNSMISNDWSWRVRTGVYPSTVTRCFSCKKGAFQLAFGRSRSFLSKSNVIYLLATGSLEVDNGYEEDGIIGAGADLGMVLNLTEGWKTQLELSGTRAVAGDTHSWWSAKFHQRWTLSQHSDIRLELNYLEESEAMLAFNLYF